MNGIDNVIDFKEIKKTREIVEIVGETFLIVKINMRSGFSYVEIERAGKREEYKVRGRVLLKQLELMESYVKNGLKVRVTLMKRTSRNGQEYYLFV